MPFVSANNVNPKYFWNLGHVYTGHKVSSSYGVGLRRFKSFYGVSPNICFKLWQSIIEVTVENIQPKHLLWGLNFLKQNNNEATKKALFHADEKTIRKWIWIVIKLLANLDTVKFENRFVGANPEDDAFVSLDGVDFKILEPIPFDSKWYSHKFKSAGLRYEIGICVRTGHIVWKFGGYPCGLYPDLKIARELYVNEVSPGEFTFADRGYGDRRYFILPSDIEASDHKRIMSRHETVNKRIRHFNILKDTFRHDLSKHTLCFDAVVNVTQLIIELEEPLFPI